MEAAAHLHDQGGSGEGRAHGGGEQARHAQHQQGGRLFRGHQPGIAQGRGQQGAGHAARQQDGHEDAAGNPRGEAHAGKGDLARQQQCQGEGGQAQVLQLQGGQAHVARDLRPDEQQHAAADKGEDDAHGPGQPAGPVLPEQQTDHARIVHGPQQAAGHAGQQGQPVLAPVQAGQPGEGEDQAEVQHHVHHEPGGQGRKAGEEQHGQGERGLHLLEGEEHAGHGRAEGGGHARHAAAHQIAGPVGAAAVVPHIAHARAHGGAHHDAGALAPHGKTGAERGQGGHELAPEHPRPAHGRQLSGRDELHLRDAAAADEGLITQEQPGRQGHEQQPGGHQGQREWCEGILPGHMGADGAVDDGIEPAEQADDPAGDEAREQGLGHERPGALAAQGSGFQDEGRQRGAEGHGDPVG